MLAVYAPFVLETAVSFEEAPPSAEEFARRVESAQSGWAWLVAERAGEVLGYAYGTAHRARPAYRWSVEVSAYVGPSARGEGVGRALYAALFERLAERGYYRAFAGVTLPNEASEAFHRSLGFEPVGTFHAVGWKHGAWHDVAWYQRWLREGRPDA